jgi:hypothetical protein
MVLMNRPDHHKNRMKVWSSAPLIAMGLCLAGCADGAKLVQEHDRGGVVVYPFKGEQGSMLSTFRTDALNLIKEKCGGPYTIVREGETKGRSKLASPIEGAQEVIQERRWGIQFQCK